MCPVSTASYALQGPCLPVIPQFTASAAHMPFAYPPQASCKGQDSRVVSGEYAVDCSVSPHTMRPTRQIDSPSEQFEGQSQGPRRHQRLPEKKYGSHNKKSWLGTDGGQYWGLTEQKGKPGFRSKKCERMGQWGHDGFAEIIG